MKFIDEASIHIESGKGGPGCVSFRREAHVPRGGPDGGDGGWGGDIVFEADPNLSTLIDFRYNRIYKAEDGDAGRGQKMSGANASSITIRVPLGTVIRDKKTRELLADLTNPLHPYTALEGGQGGKGNHFFKSSTQQAPLHAQTGIGGKKRDVTLELKLLADVGLIGFPNAGKSTLISRISNARPKIADYPFTTLAPNLGVVRIDENESYVVADIPGLIEGAHRGTGLGIKFLKHIERTEVFLHLIDLYEKNPIERFETINNELKKFNPKLTQKKQIVVLTKADLLAHDGQKTIDDLKSIFNKRGFTVYDISAVQGKGIQTLVKDVWRTVKTIKDKRLQHDNTEL